MNRLFARPPVWSLSLVLVTALLLTAAPPAAFIGQPAGPAASPDALPAASGHVAEIATLRQVVVSLPLAALLGTVLAFRPRRRGTPPQDPAVIQTQIILAIVGAVVMLVVGASLARAFGIVGAASLVRYRSKIEDPKDAGVMLSCLAIGLAAGVGIHWVAAASTLFILGCLWLLESWEPEALKEFMLRIKLKEGAKPQDAIEDLLRKHKVKFELRTSAPDDLMYRVMLPRRKRTDLLTSGILALGKKDSMEVEWSAKKPGKE
jgi:uncharacterized membrane protein YhiD involved in acid resistance